MAHKKNCTFVTAVWQVVDRSWDVVWNIVDAVHKISVGRHQYFGWISQNFWLNLTKFLVESHKIYRSVCSQINYEALSTFQKNVVHFSEKCCSLFRKYQLGGSKIPYISGQFLATTGPFQSVHVHNLSHWVWQKWKALWSQPTKLYGDAICRVLELRGTLRHPAKGRRHLKNRNSNSGLLLGRLFLKNCARRILNRLQPSFAFHYRPIFSWPICHPRCFKIYQMRKSWANLKISFKNRVLENFSPAALMQ